ncbi:MAG: SH3 domain-containing protein [Kiritimatiellae bacterium]|nr:SH3 domain-containing protein [Kiritimatiellia bacterium]
MKRLLCMVIAGVLASGAARAETVRVVGQRVNLRARADLKAEVVGQVADGELLEARSTREDWVEIAPPESVDLWVHKDFVQGGKVAATELKVRAGPGINYTVVANLPRGAAVTVRGEFTDWLKIAPPPAASLWVSRGYVEPAGAPRPAPPPAVPPSAASVEEPAAPSSIPPPPPVVPSASRPRPPPAAGTVVSQRVVRVQTGREPVVRPPPAGLDLIPFEGQGRAVQQDGVLKRARQLLRGPARFRLVAVGDGLATLCYVQGNDDQLRSFEGRRLLIRGREYWARGVQYPVVVPDQIIPKAGP